MCRTCQFDGYIGNGLLRRISLVAGPPGEGPLTEPP